MSGAKVWTSWSRIHVEHCSPDAERGNRRSRKKNHSLLVAARHIETIIDPRAPLSPQVCDTSPIPGLVYAGKVEAIENNLGRKPAQASADSGYCSESNLEALEAHGVDGYVAPGRAKHPTAANGKIGGPLTQRMRKKIDDGGLETPYRLRKQVVEPVFGQIKQARGFRQFLLRGIEKVRAEWAMICTAHNLLKLFTPAKAA